MKNKVAIVTGAARGIDYGIATCLARKGVNVVIADMNGKAAKESAAALAAKHKVKTLGPACDITQRKQVQTMVSQTVKRFGGNVMPCI